MVLVSDNSDIVVATNYMASLTLGSALPVASGGTGSTSATAYAVQCGGTTSTGAYQSVASVGTSGQVLTSNGAGALPSFQTLTAFVSGMLMPYAGSTAPSGWLLCYGQAISRTTYADLFTAISTTYGSGDGSTTFNVPDFRGRAAFGLDNMGGTAANRITNAVSGITGTTLGSAGGDQNSQSHTHTASVTDPGHSHDYRGNQMSGSGGVVAPGTNTGTLQGTFNVNSNTTGITVSNSTTGSGSSQNMPPAIVVTYIIKT
jgi:microcystin-dependent protein